MSDTSSADSPSAEAAPTSRPKPKTSPVGRIVIGVLLLVVAVEAIAHFRVTWTKSRLTDELAKSEQSDYRANRETVNQILGDREPDLTKLVQAHVGNELYDVYYFNGLVSTISMGVIKPRVLCLHFGIQGEKDADNSKREFMEVLTVVPEAVLFAEDS